VNSIRKRFVPTAILVFLCTSILAVMSGPALAATKVFRSVQIVSSEQLEDESTGAGAGSGKRGGSDTSVRNALDDYQAYVHEEEEADTEDVEDDEGGDGDGNDKRQLAARDDSGDGTDSGGGNAARGGDDSETSGGGTDSNGGHAAGGGDDSETSGGHDQGVKGQDSDDSGDHGQRPAAKKRPDVKQRPKVRVRPRKPIQRIPDRVLPRPPTAPRAQGPPGRAVLPFTGPADAVGRYALLALILMMCGATFVAMGSVDRGLMYRRRYQHR
jgi:hypothetical protein